MSACLSLADLDYVGRHVRPGPLADEIDPSSPAALQEISMCRRGFRRAGDRAAHVVPAVHCRQAIRYLAVTAAELN